MVNNTIFDDVFRTMLEKMTQLVIPLINEVFHTSYREDEEIVQLRNEQQLEDREIITDARLRIRDKVYHIECQSTDEVTMAIRMVEYDFEIALESGWRIGRKYHIEFPKSCVVYLRHGKNTPDVLEVEMVLPDGKVCEYRIPVLKMGNYTKDSIFEKKLLILLPFYVMKYEKTAGMIEKDSEMLQELLKDYEDIRKRLEKEMALPEKAELYMDLNKLIIRIADHIFRNEENVRKGVDEVMGGKVLQLESERLREEGELRGKAIGKVEGEAIGEERLRRLINHLIADGRMDEIPEIAGNAERCRELYREYGL